MKLFKKKELTEQEIFNEQLKRALKKYPKKLRKRYAFLWIEYQKGNILKIGEENGKVS